MCIEMEQEQIMQVEEQHEDESATLILRKSGNGISEHNGHKIEPKVGENGSKNEESHVLEEEQVTEEVDGVVENEAERLQKLENLVFYDRVEGIWKCRICTWTYGYGNGNNVFEHIPNHKGLLHKLMNVETLNFESQGTESKSTSETLGENKRVTDSESKELDTSSFSSGVEDNYNAATDDRYEGGLEKHDFSGSTVQPCEISCQELNANPKSSMEIEHEEVDLLNELDDSEVAEYDVENVIQNQTTHDLYCPNCNSCITRKVILRKRKRRIPTSDEESKRNKIEAAVDSKVDTGLLHSLGNTVNQTDGASNYAQIPTEDDDDGDDERVKGPDIFRCLSCFSFFLPTGDVFHFRIFGDRSGKTIVEDKQATNIRKHWFSSVPASNKHDISAEKDSSGTNLQKDLQRPSLNGKLLTGDAEKLDVRTTEAVDARIASEYDTHTSNQLKDSKSNHLFSTPLTQRTDFTKGDSAKDVVLFQQEGGFTVLVHPNDGSAAVETSEEGQVPNEAKQKKGEVDLSGVPQQMITKTKIEIDTIESLKISSFPAQGKDAVITIDKAGSSHQILQGLILPTSATSLSQSTAQNRVTGGDRTETERRDGVELEVIKSIVYGGLAESITSLSVVSSAAAGGAATLNVLALGAANLIGGLFVILHNLWELRSESEHTEQVVNRVSDDASYERDRYRTLLGRREKFLLHAFVAIVSYIIFGLVPPVAYGFSFHKTDDKQLKLFAVAAASLVCILVLAMGRAYVSRPPKPYLKTVATFVVLGFSVSGVSYGAGILIERLLSKLGLFHADAVPSVLFPGMRATAGSALAYY